MAGIYQESLFSDELNPEDQTPAAIWEKDAAKRALDELFTLTYQYKTSESYKALMQFVARFRFYSPFNAMLIHVQMPGAKYVAPPYRWLRDFGRRIKTSARPLVILQPMGPVMFVFDVADTEPTKHSRPLPSEVERPFEVRRGTIKDELEKLTENAKRDGVRITRTREGSQRAGSIRQIPADVKATQRFNAGVAKYVDIPVLYDLLLNDVLKREAQFATIVHELAHLYCGHLGTPEPRWWPDRRGLDRVTREFEAESVTYLVCTRFGIDNPSEEYLSGYVKEQEEVPPISLDCVMKVAGFIETMSRQMMKPRKPAEG